MLATIRANATEEQPVVDLESAEAFVRQHGTDVEQARLAYLLAGRAPSETIAHTLFAGQRPNGGWPSFWAPHYSSLDATCYRLAQADQLGLASQEPVRRGINTTLTFRGVDDVFPVFDSSGNLIAFKDTHQEHDTFTAANGKSVDLHSEQNLTATLTPNPDGSFTVVNTYKGLPEQISTPNGPVLTRDAGIITFVDVFDSQGNFLSQTVTVENGPHPEADSGGALFCQVVTAALT